MSSQCNRTRLLALFQTKDMAGIRLPCWIDTGIKNFAALSAFARIPSVLFLHDWTTTVVFWWQNLKVRTTVITTSSTLWLRIDQTRESNRNDCEDQSDIFNEIQGRDLVYLDHWFSHNQSSGNWWRDISLMSSLLTLLTTCKPSKCLLYDQMSALFINAMVRKGISAGSITCNISLAAPSAFRSYGGYTTSTNWEIALMNCERSTAGFLCSYSKEWSSNSSIAYAGI